MTPDHKALCDRLLAPWFTNGCAEYQREAAEAIATLSKKLSAAEAQADALANDLYIAEMIIHYEFGARNFEQSKVLDAYDEWKETK